MVECVALSPITSIPPSFPMNGPTVPPPHPQLNLVFMVVEEYGDEVYLGEMLYREKAQTDLQELLLEAEMAGEKRQASILASVPPSVSKAIEQLEEKPPPVPLVPRVEQGPTHANFGLRVSSPRSAAAASPRVVTPRVTMPHGATQRGSTPHAPLTAPPLGGGRGKNGSATQAAPGVSLGKQYLQLMTQGQVDSR